MTKPVDNFDMVLDIDTAAGIITEGVHRARCTEAAIEANKNRDGNNLVLDFEIISDESAGKKIKMWQSLKPSVAWRYTTVLAAFGIKHKEGESQVRISRGAIVNKIVRLQISHNDYNGNTRAQIDNVLDAEESKTLATAPAAPTPNLPVAPPMPAPPVRPPVPTPAPAPAPAPVQAPPAPALTEEMAVAPAPAPQPAPAPVEAPVAVAAPAPIEEEQEADLPF